MIRRVLYVAHPLRPTEDEIAATGHVACEYAVEVATKYNAGQALAWRNWLRDTFPDITFVAPWIGDVLAGDDDSDPAQRARGIRDNCALIAKLDGIVLCGPRISAGMAAERDAFIGLSEHAPIGMSAEETLRDRCCRIFNLTGLGSTPPAALPLPIMNLREIATWARG